KDIYQKSHDQARGLKTDRVPIIFINKYFTQFIPGKQEGYATTTKSLPRFFRLCGFIIHKPPLINLF
ncbi:hypothetical protein, partial [Microcystis sp. M169S2]|uniref:hypothetical protein n=1 Tax=Microcystis sp. M169S2 TaxID=2771157 RepID=UPI00258CC09A